MARTLFVLVLPLLAACAGRGGDNPDVARAREMYMQGEEAYKAREYRRAVEAYTEAIRINPDYAQAYLLRGNAYTYLSEQPDGGNVRELRLRALQDYTWSLEKNPAMYDAAFNRGILLVVLKRFHEAVRDFIQCTQLRPSDPEPHLQIGQLYETRFENMGLRAMDHYEHYMREGGTNVQILDKVKAWQALKQQNAPPAPAKQPTPEEEDAARKLHDRMTVLVGEGRTDEVARILDELLGPYGHTKYVRERTGPFNAMRRALQPPEKK